MASRTPAAYKTYISSNGINATVIENQPAYLSGFDAFNLSTANIVYLKLYDKATTPNPATDTPVAVYPIAKAESQIPGGAIVNFRHVVAFSKGIAFVLVTGHDDTNTSGVTADSVRLNFRIIKDSFWI